MAKVFELTTKIGRNHAASTPHLAAIAFELDITNGTKRQLAG